LTLVFDGKHGVHACQRIQINQLHPPGPTVALASLLNGLCRNINVVEQDVYRGSAMEEFIVFALQLAAIVAIPGAIWLAALRDEKRAEQQLDRVFRDFVDR
jgi:hypothetical protein